ncbi:lustrin, cysteine-rich repeated domain-containing protein [Ditylenchus destructor]|nr:lustrin, cysteine-rich repeated domain-containing protein [Ditylenchus destructor]
MHERVLIAEKPERRKSRCLGRKTFLPDGFNAVACVDGGHCPFGYECSTHTTDGIGVCCQDRWDNVCPENREPYRHRDTDSYTFCGLDSDVCPKGYLCKISPRTRRKLCCSGIAYCKEGFVPQIDPNTHLAKRCFLPKPGGFFKGQSNAASHSSECTESYACQDSTVKDLFVCCTTPALQQTPLRAISTSSSAESGAKSGTQWVVLEGRKR